MVMPVHVDIHTFSFSLECSCIVFLFVCRTLDFAVRPVAGCVCEKLANCSYFQIVQYIQIHSEIATLRQKCVRCAGVLTPTSYISVPNFNLALNRPVTSNF